MNIQPSKSGRFGYIIKYKIIIDRSFTLQQTFDVKAFVKALYTLKRPPENTY